MNKYELKSLLENIYEAMILPGLADPYLKNPSLLNPTPPTPPKPPVLTPGGLDDPYTIDDLLRFLRGLSGTFKGTRSVAEQADTVNKQDLKSLLENIYRLLAEEGDDRPPLISPPTSPGLYIPGYGFVPLPPTDDDPIDQDEGDFTLEMTPEQLERLRLEYEEQLRIQEEERQRLLDLLRGKRPRPPSLPGDGGTIA